MMRRIMPEPDDVVDSIAIEIKCITEEGVLLWM